MLSGASEGLGYSANRTRVSRTLYLSCGSPFTGWKLKNVGKLTELR